MLKYSNLQKPSNKRFKLIADFLLYVLPVYLSGVMALPISENTKLWITFGATFVTITLKALTKFTSNET